MLSPSELTTLKQTLSAEKETLVHQSQEGVLFSQNKDRSRQGRDSIDESTTETFYATTLRFHDRNKDRLKLVDQALERLEQGIIHLCVECEETIGTKRLLLLPITSLCVDCQQDKEEQKKTETTDDTISAFGVV